MIFLHRKVDDFVPFVVIYYNIITYYSVYIIIYYNILTYFAYLEIYIVLHIQASKVTPV